MNPAELKANADRFSEAGRRAESALERLRAFQEAEPLPDGLAPILEDYIAAVGDMLESSSELIAPAIELASK